MRHRFNAGLLGGVVVLALALSGCPPRRIDFGTRGQIDDPEALLKLVAETEAKVISANGESKVHVDSPEAKGAFSMFLAVSRPNLIHLEPLDFFGRPQAVLIVNGDQFGLYQSQENRFYRGPATAENVARFLPIALPPGELVQVMLGVVPRIPHDAADLTVDEKCACYVLTLKKGAVTQRLEVNPNQYRITKSELHGLNAYDLELGDLETVDGVAFPKKVALKAAAARIEVSLSYGDLSLNQAPDLTMFDTAPTEGAEIVELDEHGYPKTPNAPLPTAPQLAPDAAPATAPAPSGTAPGASPAAPDAAPAPAQTTP